MVLDLSEAGFDFHLVTAQRQPFLKLVVTCNQVGAKGNQKRAQHPYYSSDLGNLERQEYLYFQWRKSQCHISVADRSNWQTNQNGVSTNGMKG